MVNSATALYRSVDERGRPYNKDPLNAIWEQVFGEPYKFPRSLWYRQPDSDYPGGLRMVGWGRRHRRRKLGVFTENGLAVESVQWRENGSFEVAASE
jgi:hypothetical protein